MAGTISFVNAHDLALTAYWRGAGEEFTLDPFTGIVWWRVLGEDDTERPWGPVPDGRGIPQAGWSHRSGCGCALCRRTR